MVDGREVGGPKSPPGFPGPHGLTVRPRRLRMVSIEKKCHSLLEYNEIQPYIQIPLSSESRVWSIVDLLANFKEICVHYIRRLFQNISGTLTAIISLIATASTWFSSLTLSITSVHLPKFVHRKYYGKMANDICYAISIVLNPRNPLNSV